MSTLQYNMPFKDKKHKYASPSMHTVAIMKGQRKVPNQETSPKADSQCWFWEHDLPR